MNNERSCDKLLVKNNSRKHFVVFCALIEAKGTDIKMIKEELLITHHGRTLHGYFFKPEEKGCFPLVIMSHGYNGCKDDFEKTAKYLADAKIASVACTFCGEVQGRVWFSNNADDFIYGKGRFDGNIGKHGAKT